MEKGEAEYLSFFLSTFLLVFMAYRDAAFRNNRIREAHILEVKENVGNRKD